MSLEFIVISYNSKCEEYSENIVNSLNKCKHLSAKLDTNYNQTITTRQNKYKKDKKDIIIIDEVCLVNNEVIVKYSDKGSKSKRYDKDEFIELLESFESTSEQNYKTNEEKEKKEEENNDSCLIM
jgi:hypothetical protein